MHDVGVFLLGGLAMGDLIAGLFFLRYWIVTQDRFFLYFAAAFAIQMVCRMLLIGTTANSESEPLVYVFRLLSYGVILAGIFDKNRAKIAKALSGPP
ncbi:conserved membrane protein of unknown function [Nitrospira japonica]|uniref:Uncharacterized protein n=1 Tax=Nitrospira japonica TaxID=1325564 RepID=A0A1W1I310_9BACT|nr:DUF5985 family protein [Nitrospira japonica]SLM47355.1 conserved membrane protein of unknown function [Nitrospira japonica]